MGSGFDSLWAHQGNIMNASQTTNIFASPAFTIVPLDLSSDDMILACREVSAACVRQIHSDYVPPSPETFLSYMRQEGTWTKRSVVALTADNRTVIGWALASFSEDAQDPVFIDVSVTPHHRRQGVGTALEEAARNLCPREHPAKQFFSESYLPGGADAATHPFTLWAQSLGWRFNELDHTLRLAWPADRRSLLQLRPPVPAGYRIETYIDGVPPALQESLGVVVGEMDAEAPTGEVEFSAAAVTSEQYQADLARVTSGGAHLVETIAIFADRVVGFTRIQIPGETKRVMRVRGTGVLREHRGKRLGLLLKTQIELELLDRGFVDHPAIETETAINNPWMLDIQRKLGFIEFSQLAGYVRERP